MILIRSASPSQSLLSAKQESHVARSTSSSYTNLMYNTHLGSILSFRDMWPGLTLVVDLLLAEPLDEGILERLSIVVATLCLQLESRHLFHQGAAGCTTLSLLARRCVARL